MMGKEKNLSWGELERRIRELEEKDKDPFHLNEACAALSSDNAKLKRMVERRDKELVEFAEENARLRKTVLDLNASNSELIIESERLRKNMEEMKRIVGDGEIPRVPYCKDCKRLTEELAIAKEANRVLKEKVVSLNKSIDKEDRYINRLESENKKLRDKLERIECVLEEKE